MTVPGPEPRVVRMRLSGLPADLPPLSRALAAALADAGIEVTGGPRRCPSRSTAAVRWYLVTRLPAAGHGPGAHPACTYTAVRAIAEVVRAEGDFGSWLASVLTIAAQLGSASALTAGRPGSWEGQRVDELVYGTAGYDCEDLADSGYADELDRTGPSCQAGQHHACRWPGCTCICHLRAAP